MSERCLEMYCLYLPAILVFTQYDLWKRWLACQRITYVPMVASIVGSFANIPLIYVLMF